MTNSIAGSPKNSKCKTVYSTSYISNY